MEDIAWRKLQAAGLRHHFKAGAFGDEAEDRSLLPALAVARMQHATNMSYSSREVWIVGDTPDDIACGHVNGFRTIAVATGPVHSYNDLKAECPDFVIADLSELLTLPLWDSDPATNSHGASEQR